MTILLNGSFQILSLSLSLSLCDVRCANCLLLTSNILNIRLECVHFREISFICMESGEVSKHMPNLNAAMRLQIEHSNGRTEEKKRTPRMHIFVHPFVHIRV